MENSVGGGPGRADEGVKNVVKHVVFKKQFSDEQGNDIAENSCDE